MRATASSHCYDSRHLQCSTFVHHTVSTLLAVESWRSNVAETRMLVLSRKVGESFVIGDHITVTVVRILGGAVRLGIEAPPDYIVVRGELQDAESSTELRHVDLPNAEEP